MTSCEGPDSPQTSVDNSPQNSVLKKAVTAQEFGEVPRLPPQL